ncbi:hypothetical protein [Pelistega europaea]|uniref:Uncharacterized protein n=1 Tax=Pelistega europaea TaxID=106147 RepID=A0A7Y4LC14_9BURK|nr:hypothetical protein [Pelistega europaea]NOL49776.1 hypothetical protein [Pelistega europaea]
MYAPLQQAWCQTSLVLSNHVELHLRALVLFLLLFGLLGWTSAWMVVGLFYTHYSPQTFCIDIMPTGLVWRHAQQQEIMRPEQLDRGFCWLSFKLSHQRVTIWRWQMSLASWRRLCAITSTW